MVLATSSKYFAITARDHNQLKGYHQNRHFQTKLEFLQLDEKVKDYLLQLVFEEPHYVARLAAEIVA